MDRFPILVAALMTTVFLGTGGYTLIPREWYDPACNIKGNISISGHKIYHVPGQEDYAATKVRLGYGERWFCSEAAAVRAGWRRAAR